MPRPPEPPRLWLRPARYANGKLRKAATWVILDGGQERGTGCSLEDRQGAEQALEIYLADKRQPSRKKGQDIDEILLADVCALYLADVAPEHAKPEKTAQRFVQLLEWWGDKTLGDVNGRACRDYAKWRQTHAWKAATKAAKPRMVTAAGARRELQDLAAAIGYHRREGYHRELVIVTLPPKSPARTRYLKRSEVAAMVWAAWRKREAMIVTRGYRKGMPVESKRRPWRHIARFILIGTYTGTGPLPSPAPPSSQHPGMAGSMSPPGSTTGPRRGPSNRPSGSQRSCSPGGCSCTCAGGSD